MLEQVKNRILPYLMEYKLLKAFLALVGALLVAVGFQNYSIVFIPPGGLVAIGILIEVSLVYVFAIGIERAREDIVDQRKEIDRMLKDVRRTSQDVDQAKNEVDDVRQEVSRTKTEITESQQEIENVSKNAQKTKEEIKDLKRSIERGLSE